MATLDLLRDNLEDVGFEGGAARAGFGAFGRAPPVLYPPIEIHSPAPITEEDFFCIQKLREITHRYHFVADDGVLFFHSS